MLSVSCDRNQLKPLSVQFSSVAQSCPTLYDPMNCSTPGLPVHLQLPESTQTIVHWVGDAIQPSHPLLPLLFMPSIFPSIKVFSSESVLPIRWPKYWSFSFSISPSNEYSFRIDWFDLLAIQGTLKSSPVPQFKSINSSALRLLYGPTLTSVHDYWKNKSFDYMGLVSKVMSLLFNMLSRIVIAFLSRSKHLLISWLQSPSTVILEPMKIKSDSFHIFPIFCHEMIEPDATILFFWMLSFKPVFLHSPFFYLDQEAL